MLRRKFLKGAFLLPSFTRYSPSLLTALAVSPKKAPFKRVRPTDAGWPSEAKWQKLKLEVNGSLIKIESPLNACKIDAKANACKELFRELRNPYFIGDEPALTQSAGLFNAWTSAPSIYAVAAKNADDVAAAVNFARINKLRLVVKGGGHSYQGTSNAPDSLLIWTRAMNKIELLDQFVPVGCEGRENPQQAVTVGSGAIWKYVYEAVTAKAGRYVQGGGCLTVGVAGLIQSGGFGSFSKKYGLAAAALLEAEIVTADGRILVVNACQHPDLFWGLKGGGGGSLGVVTRITLKTRDLPNWFGSVSGSIKANSDDAYKKLIERMISFYGEQLFNPNWGEQFQFYADNHIGISMVFQGIDNKQAKEIWKPFKDWVNSAPQEYTWQKPLEIGSLPAKFMWNSAILTKLAPSAVVKDDRPNAPSENIFWRGDQDQVGLFWHGYHSAWLPAELLNESKQQQLANALFATTRLWSVGLHFNKGLANAPAEEIAAAKDTATNPSVLTAFALAIIAGGDEKGPVFPGIAGHEPDMQVAARAADLIKRAMETLRLIASDTGSYVSETNFFEPDWQHSFWGTNYSKLSEVKSRYDPDGLFFVHHGVGSEEWSDDGFTKLSVSK